MSLITPAKPTVIRARERSKGCDTCRARKVKVFIPLLRGKKFRFRNLFVNYLSSATRSPQYVRNVRKREGHVLGLSLATSFWMWEQESVRSILVSGKVKVIKS